jgi:glycine cleavage system aminomethyltransferase T
LGASLVVEGAEVGKVTSAAPAPGAGGSLALAYVGRAVTPPAAAQVRHGGEALPVTVVDLPME